MLNRSDMALLESMNLMTTDEVAEFLGVSKRTIHNYRRDLGLPYSKFGSGRTAAIRFQQDEVEEWVRAISGKTATSAFGADGAED